MKYAVSFILIFILLSTGVFAELNFKSMVTEIDLKTNEVTINSRVVSSTNISSIVIATVLNPYNIESQYPTTVEKTDNGYMITIRKFLTSGEPSDISLSFKSNNIVDAAGDKTIFTFTYDQPVDSFKLRVLLPPESAIVNKGGLIVSKPVSISSDGERIILEWNDIIVEGEQFSSFVHYTSKPLVQTNTIIGLILVTIFAFGIGYWLKKFERHKTITQILSEDEKKIVSILRKGETLQEELREKLGWSKTKVSKVLRKLESKELITKKPFRKTNKLKIK